MSTDESTGRWHHADRAPGQWPPENAPISCAPSVPHAGLSFHSHRDGGLIFDARRRLLYGLNRAGGLCWMALVQGGPACAEAALRNALDLPSGTARTWVEACVASFEELGFFRSPLVHPGPCADSHPPTPGSGPCRTELPASLEVLCDPDPEAVRFEGRLLDLNFTVDVPADQGPAIAGLLRPLLLGRAREAGGVPKAAALRIVPTCTGGGDGGGDRFAIVRGRGVEASDVGLAALATQLEAVLVTAAIRTTPHLLTLHAGVLAPPRTLTGPGGAGGAAVLLAGASGRGKTTLCLALIRAGWHFGSDDLCLLTRSGDVRPLPLDPCVKKGSLEVAARWFPEIRGLAPVNRFGREARFAPVAAGARVGTCRPRTVIFPFYSAGGGTGLVAVERAEGLQLLLEDCPSIAPDFKAEDVDIIARWHESVSYWALPFDDAESAAGCLSAAIPRALPADPGPPLDVPLWMD